ncbi:60S ribosomal protein L31B [Blastocladiella emersonii ATCC 22665]|nr:60S ribosomal protein L31B [Blastocladiella emersonii ATCC 22665]
MFVRRQRRELDASLPKRKQLSRQRDRDRANAATEIASKARVLTNHSIQLQFSESAGADLARPVAVAEAPGDAEANKLCGRIIISPQWGNNDTLRIAIHAGSLGERDQVHLLALPVILGKPPLVSKMVKGFKRSASEEVVTREYTIHLHRSVFGTSFKKRAPKAIKAIREFAAKHMGTKDIRLAPELNVAVWERGVKSVPHRMRLRISRKRNDDEKAAERMYALVEYVAVDSFKGLQTTNVE